MLFCMMSASCLLKIFRARCCSQGAMDCTGECLGTSDLEAVSLCALLVDMVSCTAVRAWRSLQKIGYHAHVRKIVQSWRLLWMGTYILPLHKIHRLSQRHAGTAEPRTRPHIASVDVWFNAELLQQKHQPLLQHCRHEGGQPDPQALLASIGDRAAIESLCIHGQALGMAPNLPHASTSGHMW